MLVLLTSAVLAKMGSPFALKSEEKNVLFEQKHMISHLVDID